MPRARPPSSCLSGKAPTPNYPTAHSAWKCCRIPLALQLCRHHRKAQHRHHRTGTPVAAAFEQLNIPVGKDHAAELDRITLHGNTYRLQVRGTYGQHHSISYYSELDNPILDFMNDARQRLLACVPPSLQDFVDPPPSP
ncbi:MAG TPA: hypothetical protein PKZ27_13755 [Rhodocyclaceae bacterium]|nr:hypothetical protein [Rhodocyclaceae bacterium]